MTDEEEPSNDHPALKRSASVSAFFQIPVFHPRISVSSAVTVVFSLPCLLCALCGKYPRSSVLLFHQITQGLNDPMGHRLGRFLIEALPSQRFLIFVDIFHVVL